MYGSAGFVVQTTMMDKFDKLKNMLPHIAINTMAAREHVGEIEQKIRVIKERARGTINTLPYKMPPRLMVIELLHLCVMWMNSFPIRSGISDKWSPRELVSSTCWMQSYTAGCHSDHTVRCMLTQRLLIL